MDKSIQKTTLYRYFNDQDQLLYVGITGDNTKRQSQHRRNSFWFGEIGSATFEHFDTRSEALDAESEAIRYENPLHNIARGGFTLQHSPYSHMLFLSGMPDNGHDKIHSAFSEEYRRLFEVFDGRVQTADMVIVAAMQFALGKAGDSPNLTECDLCKSAYSSEWFAQTFKELKRTI